LEVGGGPVVLVAGYSAAAGWSKGPGFKTRWWQKRYLFIVYSFWHLCSAPSDYCF